MQTRSIWRAVLVIALALVLWDGLRILAIVWAQGGVGGGIYGQPPGTTENDLRVWKSSTWVNRFLAAADFVVGGSSISLDSSVTQMYSEIGNNDELYHGNTITIDGVGHIGIDDDSGQLQYWGNSANRAFAYEKTNCAVVEMLESTDDFYVLKGYSSAVTITRFWCVCDDDAESTSDCNGATLADISLYTHGDTEFTTSGDADCVKKGTVPTAQTVTSNANSQLAAYEPFAFGVETTLTDDGQDRYQICWSYTIDPT